MRQIDRVRRQVSFQLERANNVKRLLILFTIVDVLVVIGLFSFFEGIFWIAVLVIAAIISVFLIIRLHRFARAKQKDIDVLLDMKRQEVRDGERKLGLL